MAEFQADKTKGLKKPRVSLSVKLNLLMVAVIFTVAAVLIIISYNVYTRTVYEPVSDSLQYWVERSSQTLEETAEDFDGQMLNRPEMLKRLLKAAESEDLQSIRRSTSDPAELKTRITEWMMTASDYNEENELDSNSLYGAYLMSWYSLYDLRRFHSISRERELYEVWVEGLSGENRYLLVMDSDNETGVPFYNFGETKPLPDGLESCAFDEPVAPVEKNRTLYAANPVRDEEGKVIARVWALVDVNDVLSARRDFLLISILLTLGLAVVAICLTVLLLRRIVLRPVRDLSHAASAFASGDDGQAETNVVSLNIKSNDEIGDLYHEIRSMQSRIIDYTEEKAHSAAERERIRTELDLAARIQNSMLPHTFPPFPDRTEFDIYASMTPAKEVAGDFYDFFFVDPDHLCLLIADVSGKGVPASLYMMISKVILQSCAMLNLPADQIIRKANEALSNNNPEQMFVTIWLGILEVSTGILTAVNAGHEYPAVMQAGKPFEILKDLHGALVGAFESYPYKAYQIQLRPGDKIFVYTDGVPEATDTNGAMYGMDRLAVTLKYLSNETPENILRGVRASVDSFVNGAPQFDDLTMLCFEYKGSPQS